MSLSICAVIAVRNEAPYLEYLLPRLAAQGIDVAVLDHGSEDATRNLLERHRDDPVIRIEQLPYRGTFALEEQLAAKRLLIGTLTQDWIIHLDADEVLEHRNPGSSLRAAIEEAQGFGANVVNFEEFTFIPEPDADYSGRDYYAEMHRYYFFEKWKNWLHRAWRRDAGLDNTALGGHVLSGEHIRMCPYTHVMRHYIALSQAHIRRKYLTRSFAEAEVARGWHRDRVRVTHEALQLPTDDPCIKTLGTADNECLCRAAPVASHYWHWPRERAEGIGAQH